MSHIKAFLLFLIVGALAALLWLQQQPVASQKQKLQQVEQLLAKHEKFRARLAENGVVDLSVPGSGVALRLFQTGVAGDDARSRCLATRNRVALVAHAALGP